MAAPQQPLLSSAFTTAARLANTRLSFSAEPLDTAAFLASGAGAAKGAKHGAGAGATAAAALDTVRGSDSSDEFDHAAEKNALENDLHPARLRDGGASRATAAGAAYARSLSCALETAASGQLAGSGVRTSGPQGKVLPFTIIDDPAAWTATDWAGGVDSIVYILNAADAAAIRAAAAAHVTRGAPLAGLRRAVDFELPPATAARLAAVKVELLAGRGVAVLRGLPFDDMDSEPEVLAAYLGVCAHIGQPGPQWKCGRIVTHVTSKGTTVDQNLAASKHGPEAFNRSDAFEMHNDSCADVLGLLCIRQAKEGGESAFASALSVMNEMLRRGRLDLVAVLAGAGFYRDKSRFHPEILPGTSPLWEMPVFAWSGGYMTTSYNANLNRQCEERYPELTGRLSPLQREAMATFDEIANSDALALRIRLQRGDIALINNINVMHSRSTFVDGEKPRHLVRMWLLCKDSPHTLPRHLTYPRSYSFTARALEAARGLDDGLFRALPPQVLYVPLSDGRRAD